MRAANRVTQIKPNLFVVGAMRSGTTTLHTLLGAHPDIFMSPIKEPCYFVQRQQLDWPQIERLGFWKGEERYLALFAAAGGRAVVGESSTLYTKAPRISGVPERIARFEPAARIVYIMRDPVERTLSHYWHAVRFGRERREPTDALEQEPHYREVSYYAMQLAPYLRLFGAERVATLTLEALEQDPRAELARLYRWLGVDDDFVPPEPDQRENPTPATVQRLRGRGYLERFRFSPVWNVVGPLMPARLRAFGRGLATSPVQPLESDVRRARAFLRPFQRDETRELESLLDRRFPEWGTLWGA